MGAGLAVNDSLLSLTEKDQAFVAALTVDAADLGATAPEEWAKTLSLSLTREKSEQDPELFPYCYTGRQAGELADLGAATAPTARSSSPSSPSRSSPPATR